MKNNKVILIVVIAVIMCILMGCGNKEITTPLDSEKEIQEIQQEENNIMEDVLTNEEQNVAKQLEVIMNNYEIWKSIDEMGIYGYTVTDLDQNGRLEIISSVEEGSGFYTYTNIYEVNESLDDLVLCDNNYEEGESQADIMNTTEWPAYYDKTNNTYHYILTDDLKINAMEAIQGKRDYVLKNGMVNETYLASKNILLNEEGEEDSFELSNGDTITEEEYNNIGYNTFKNCEQKELHVEWLFSAEHDFENMSNEEIMSLLKTSYEKTSWVK